MILGHIMEDAMSITLRNHYLMEESKCPFICNN